MKKIQSKIFTLNAWDLLKGLIVAVLSAFLTALYELLEAGTWPIEIQHLGVAALTAWVGYLIKQLFTGTKQPLQDMPVEPKNIKS